MNCLQSIAFLIISVYSLAGQNLLDNSLVFGKYQVGFKTVSTKDFSRPSISTSPIKTDTPSGRDMYLFIWYPSDQHKSNSLQYSDYLNLRIDSTSGKRNARDVFFQTIAELNADTSLFTNQFEKLKSIRVKAAKDVLPAKGNFPLVLYPDQVHFQHILCEYLASHGFVVVSPGIQGTYTRAIEYNLRGIETAVTDLSFTLGYMRQHFKLKRQFALLATGFMATPALALQMRNQDATAFISLEGGITTGFEEGLIQGSPFFDIQRATHSMLIIHAPHADVKPELTYKYKYAEKIYQHYPQSSEFYFLNFGIWGKTLKNILPKANKGNTRQSFELAAQSVYYFLDWKLNQKEKSKDSLLNNNWDHQLVQTSIKPAVPLPPHFDELFSTWQKNGINALKQLYTGRKSLDPQPIAFPVFFQFSQKLVEQSAFNDLIQWAELFTDAFPASAIPYMLEARGHLETGNKPDAKSHYEKALALLDQDKELNATEKSYYKPAIEKRLKNLF